ncbi:FAD-dependent oxidoreductase [Psychrobacillus sp. PGGUH221]|uniref:phytoene desaturase family protein n=1 Tax=Psychrobacillus sp. PGGUH221 TaxID=3020058 RepID=UPI0035C69DDF
MAQKWDVVIVGGGLAGYVAANYLAKKDLSILIVEKGKKVGGRARTDKINQHYFNLGPHALYKKGKAAPILEELDIKLNGKSPILGGTLIENKMEYTAPFNPLGLLTTRLLNWREKVEWVAILMNINSLDTEKLAEQTFQQWVMQVTISKKVQTLLYTLGRLTTYCHAPEMVSAKIIVSHMKIGMGGVLYLDYGWQMVIDQLHNKAVISGIQVQSNTVVKQIIKLQQEHFKLVLSNDEEISSKYVLNTTSPQELNKMLGEQSSISQRDFFAKITPVKGATLDVALTKLPNPKKLFAMGITDPLYYSVHSNYARLSEDRENTVLHVYKYHHPNDQIDGKEVKKELEQFLEKMQPEWKKYEITSRFMPNITVNQRLPQLGDEQKLACANIEIPGLFLAGDWVSPYSVLSEGAVSSGKQAAKEIIQLLEQR